MGLDDRVTLLTGPNMSGKSTLLKAIGICVYLAHAGIAVPAEKASVPFYDYLFVSIQANDDLASGLSHFMAEVLLLKRVLIQAQNKKRCFAIFDELFRGTNTEDALTISRATVKGLTRFGNSNFIISTHHHPLKELLKADKISIDVKYLDCRIEENKPVFTYTLLNGWSNLKVGQLIFEEEGINKLLQKF